MARSTSVETAGAAIGELASGLRLSVTRLARILRHQDGGELTPSMVSALATLNRAGRLTLGELAAREHIAAPSITRIVDKLQRAGLVTRRASETDGRVALVEVTDAGRSRIEEARSRRTAWMAKQLAKLDEDDLETLRKAAVILERMVEGADRSGPEGRT